jgi:hypothetical protein
MSSLRSIECIFYLLLIIASLTIFSNPLYAEIKSIQSDEVVVLYEGQMKGIAEEIAGVYPSVKKELVNTLEWDINSRPDIVIAKDRETFRRIVGIDIIVAFAVPQKNLIVLDISRIYTKPFSLETTLKHELCHLVLHRHIEENNLPRWFDEGVCQWASGGVAELFTGEGDRALSQATVSNNVIRIRSIDKFPRDGKRLILAYEESKSFIEYIISEYGENKLLQSLQYLKEGDSIDGSFARSFSVSFRNLEQKWLAHLQRKYTWFSYVSNNLYTILFFLAGIITLYGFFRLLKKKREYKEEEEKENNKLL